MVKFIPPPGPGRPIGSKTKPRLKYTHTDLAVILEELSFDPIREAIALYRKLGAKEKEHDQVILMKDLLGYFYAKRRTIEVAGDVTNNTLNISWNTPDAAVAHDVIPVDSIAIADEEHARMPQERAGKLLQPVGETYHSDDDSSPVIMNDEDAVAKAGEQIAGG